MNTTAKNLALPQGSLLEGSLGEDPLAAEPAGPSRALVGYARVSTRGQLLDRQMAALTTAGCIRIFADKSFRSPLGDRSRRLVTPRV
ncbi:recombinase family protein [Nonomuraea polychroma]|uniref:recombinase family protein n=1 Tax=Nonomuraea polychroma TaxID=46176 RepID=UPI00240E4016|nr:recombinase family protein [Nonomuraea polychroma]